MSGPPIVFAPEGSPLRAWARETLSGDVRLVAEPSALTGLTGAVVFCHPEERGLLGPLAEDVRLIEARPRVDWGRLAHDVRGPLGVITGALGELGDADPVVPLAVRSAGQLALLADCWERLGASPVGEPIELRRALDGALNRFAEVEPRRAKRIRLPDDGHEATAHGDPARLQLGFVRLWSHLACRGREPLSHRVDAQGRLLIEGVDPSVRDLSWTGRAGLALALLAPLTERWSEHDGRICWTPRAVS